MDSCRRSIGNCLHDLDGGPMSVRYFDTLVLTLVTFIPAIGGLLLVIVPRRDRDIRIFALIISLLTFGLSLHLIARVHRLLPGFQYEIDKAWVSSPNIHYHMGVDGISLWLVLLTTFLTPLCVLISWKAIHERVKEFFILLLVLETALIGVFTSLDLFLFYFFWESTLIPMALLIGMYGHGRKVYAAVKFFLYTMIASMLMLAAILWFYAKVGSFDFVTIQNAIKAGQVPGFEAAAPWLFLGFFLAFAVKVPLFPFHTWLPAAHVEAPTAGSVLLAGVLLKMGTYGFLRFSLPMAPYATQVFTPFILWLSVVAILYGGLTALAQTDLKKLVAYSSVAHMGFATFGIFALNQAGLEGAVLVMINHGVTTGALFIIVGIIYERLHSRDLAQAAGMGKIMPVFAMFAGVFALSSLAFPGTNSFIGEFLVMSGGFSAILSGGAPVSKVLIVCLVPGVILAAAYMLRMLQKVAYGGTRNPDHSQLRDL